MKVEELPQIDFGSLAKRVSSFVCVYHKDEDTFFLRTEPPLPAVSMDWDGELWIRIEPNTGEIVGIEIDNFEAIFLEKHPELAKAWSQVKPLCTRKHRKESQNDWDVFIRIIVNFLSKLFRDNPLQTSFSSI